MKNVEIITIGDELLIGQVVDTNSAWMAQRLNEWGYSLHQITSVHDDREHIMAALHEAEQRADIILTTGGLGPTKDDITKHVFCEYFHTSLVYRDDIRRHLEDLYRERPDVLNRLTDTQCLFPVEAQLIWNRVGSAQVMLFRHEGHTIISMPGVPYEMMWVMENGVREALQALYPSESIVHRTVQVTDIAESSLAILIEEWENSLPSSMHLAYLPKDGIIRLRLSGYGVTAEEMQPYIDRLVAILSQNNILLADSDDELEVLVGRALLRRKQTISTAESCTGGKLAQLLNARPGSSAFYMGSVVAYDNAVKREVLGVSADDLMQHGAVSEPVVRQMAEGVRRLTHTDYAIATSGIAGPDGGTPEKPVGTVWVGIATPDGTYAHCYHFTTKLRDQITTRATRSALIWLLKLMNS